ncbi:MAG: TolC family protein [Chitinophagaceae bacterium]|nr:TolC family protein [Chitinophagaceae bacterium]
MCIPKPGRESCLSKIFLWPKYPIRNIIVENRHKISERTIEISKNNQEQLSRNIRAEILSKYKRYKNYFAILSLQSQTLDDEETAFLQAKEKFRNGAITIELHNIAQKSIMTN